MTGHSWPQGPGPARTQTCGGDRPKRGQVGWSRVACGRRMPVQRALPPPAPNPPRAAPCCSTCSWWLWRRRTTAPRDGTCAWGTGRTGGCGAAGVENGQRQGRQGRGCCSWGRQASTEASVQHARVRARKGPPLLSACRHAHAASPPVCTQCTASEHHHHHTDRLSGGLPSCTWKLPYPTSFLFNSCWPADPCSAATGAAAAPLAGLPSTAMADVLRGGGQESSRGQAAARAAATRRRQQAPQGQPWASSALLLTLCTPSPSNPASTRTAGAVRGRAAAPDSRLRALASMLGRV